MRDHIGDTNEMIEKKQTAVEWIAYKWGNAIHWNWEEIKQWFEQAKEMEKEQMIDAHIEGQRVFDKHPHTQWTNDQAQQYYNETYKK